MRWREKLFQSECVAGEKALAPTGDVVYKGREDVGVAGVGMGEGQREILKSPCAGLGARSKDH